MEISNLKLLVDYIKGASEDNATKAVLEYGNRRVKYAIEESWKRSSKLFGYAMHNRQKRIKDSILDYEEDQSVISLIGLTRFVASIEDCLKKHSENASEETMDALADVADLMFNKLGSIKIDRRIIFSKSE